MQEDNSTQTGLPLEAFKGRWPPLSAFREVMQNHEIVQHATILVIGPRRLS